MLITTPQFLAVFLCLTEILASSSVSSEKLSNGLRTQWIQKGKGVGRVRREDPDNIKTFLDQVSPFARISNAITLQSGLMDGSIPVDDVVGELLNLGPIKVSQLIAMVPDSVSFFTSNLNSIRLQLKDSQEVLNVENQVLEFDKIRKDSSKVTTLKVTKEMEDYFTDVAKFSNNFNFTILGEVAKSFEKISSGLEHVATVKGDRDNSQLGRDFASLTDVMVGFDELKDELTRVTGLHKQLTEANVVKSGSKKLGPFQKMLHSMESRSKSKAIPFDSFLTDIEKLASLVLMSKASKPSVTFLKTLITAQENPRHVDRKFTSGFANGYSDLIGLQKDILDSGVQKLLNSSTQKLSTALKPLMAMPYKFSNANDKLHTLPSGSLNSINTILKLQEDLEKVTVTKKSANTVLGKYKSSMTPVAQTVTDPVKGLLDAVTALESAIASLTDLTANLIADKLKNAIKKFRDDAKFTEYKDATKGFAQVTEVIKNIQGTKALDTFGAVFSEVKQKLDGATKVNFQPLIPRIVQTELDNFIKTKEVQDEMNFQNDLVNLEDSAEQVARGVLAIRMLREFKKEARSVSDLEAVLPIISVTSSELKNLKGITVEMKALNTTETSELEQLKKEFPGFKLIGDAVLGVYKIQDFRKSKDSIQKLKLSDKTVQNGLGGDLKSLEDCLKGVEDVNAKLKIPSAPKSLAEIGAVFKSFEAIGDVKFDAVSKKKELDSLIPSAQDPTILKNAIDEIEKLEGLDLQFAKHQKSFSAAPAALGSLQKTLDSFFNPVSSSKMTSGDSTDSGGLVDGGWDTSTLAGLLAAVVVVFVLVVVLIVWIICCCCCDRCVVKCCGKQEEIVVEHLENGNGKRENGTATATTSTADGKKDSDSAPEKVPEKAADKKKEEEVKPAVDLTVEPKMEDKKEEKQEDKKEGKKEVKKEEKAEDKKEAKKPKSAKEEVKEPEVPIILEDPEKSGEVSRKNTTECNEGPRLGINRGTFELSPGEIKPNFKPKREECIVATNNMVHKNSVDLYLEDRAIQDSFFQKGYNEIDILESREYLSESKQRDHLIAPINPIRSVKVSKEVDGKNVPVPIHATEIKGRNEKKFAVTQAPLKKSATHDSTVNDFLLMVIELKSDSMVMIMEHKELDDPTFNRYFPEKEGTNLDFGDYTVELVKKEEGFQADEETKKYVITRILKITDKGKSVSRTLTHYQYIDWPEGGTPKHDHRVMYKLLQVLNESKTPVIVHSMLGLDRAMAFVGIQLGAQFIEDQLSTRSTINAVHFLRQHRPYCIRSICLMMYLHAGIVYKLFMDHSEGEERAKHMKTYNKMMSALQIMSHEKLPERELGRERRKKNTTVIRPLSCGIVIPYGNNK